MNRTEGYVEEVLEHSLPSASREQVESACERVYNRLRSDGESLEVPVVNFRPALSFGGRWVWAIAATVATLVVVAWIGAAWQRGAVYAIVEKTDGSLFRSSGGRTHTSQVEDRIREGETLRAAVGGSGIRLQDGSRVEIRSRSELSLERATDGVRIRLIRGSVIVTAAKQTAGHLYVQTKDLTVSVVGTVFLVNAEEEGSRVAVIQGEVHVQRDATVKRLLPGQQLATGPAMPAIPMAQELSWSLAAPEHVALLQRSAATLAPPATPAKFEVESIRPHSGISPGGQESVGFVCHGIDGNRRAAFEYISNAGRLIAPQGRCVGNGTWLQTLIAFAYEVPPRDVLGVPDWALPPERVNGRAQPGNAFQIEAVAEDPSTATAEDLIQMVRTMLGDRFKLHVHRESREVPGFALVLAKNGPKLKLKDPADPDELPSQVFDVPFGKPVVKGKSTMEQFAQWLSGKTGGVGAIAAPVVDRTGLKEIYDYQFDTTSGSGGGARGAGPAPGQTPRLPTPEEIAAQYSSRLDDQLGLRLIPEKAIRVEVLVVDQIERPSPN